MPERVTGPAFYFPSIEKKYGKPISYWLDPIGSSELTKHKELADWLKAALARLKEQPGGDITVGASGSLVPFLLRERLLDELQLLVHPLVARSGARLFEGYAKILPLTLAHSHAHGNGVVALHCTLAA